MRKVLLVEEGDKLGRTQAFQVLAGLQRTEGSKFAEARVVKTVDEAEGILKVGTKVGAIVFFSSSLAGRIKALAAQYPTTQMIVYDTFVPQGEIVWMSSRCIIGDLNLARVLADG